MHKVAEASPITFSVFVLSTACFPEIRDRGELRVEWPTCVPPVVQVLDSSLRFCFPLKTGVYVAD